MAHRPILLRAASALAATTYLYAFAPSDTQAQTVNGTAGCVVRPGYGADVGNQEAYGFARCGGREENYIYNNYVTASEINNAFTVLNQNVSNQIKQEIEKIAPATDYGPQIQDHSAKIQDLYTRDTNQQQQIDSLSSRVNQFNDLSARLAAAERTIAAHSSTLSEQSSTLSNHSTRLQTNETNIASIQTQTNATDSTVNNQGQQINSQGSQISQQGSTINQQGQQIDQQGNQIDQQGSQISQQGSQISQQGSQIGQQGQQIGELQQQAATTEEVVADLGTTVANQGATIAQHENRIIANETNIAALGTTVANQGATIAQHENRIIANETKIATLGTTVANQGATIAQHENRIITNETNIATLGTTVANQGATIAQHENRIITNETDIAGLKESGVRYNLGSDGKKSGGLTFNDGTGKAVQLGNVAAGKSATDAVNVSQLSSAVSALGGGAAIAPDGSMVGPSYDVAGKSYNNVGDALKATNEAGVQYVVDSNGKATNDIVLRGSGSGPVRMHNVADGVASTDAATFGQVTKARQDAIAYTDQRISEIGYSNNEQFSQLGGEIAATKREMRSGIASAMAMAGMRYDHQPGKITITGGFGSWQGVQAVSFGLGMVSEDGRWRMNAGISKNFGAESDMGVNAGVSYTLN